MENLPSDIVTIECKKSDLPQELAGEMGWCGYDICDILCEALTDANFHTLSGEINKLVEKDKKRGNIDTTTMS